MTIKGTGKHQASKKGYKHIVNPSAKPSGKKIVTKKQHKVRHTRADA